LVPIVNAVLLLYSWIVAAFLILFLLMIGRFYQIRFEHKSHFQYFALPLVCLLGAAIWYGISMLADSGGTLGDFVGLLWPDLLFLVGGVGLILLSYLLFRMMVGRGR
jgi:hypothetical protein